MICEPDHPCTPLRDWQAFCKDFSPYLIAEVIDRSECNLASWFVPLARGAAIASDSLLRRAGYRPGIGFPPEWYEDNHNYFTRHLVGDRHLMVRECEGTNLWTVEQLGGARRIVDVDNVLVHVFGSTPIFTRNCQSAMWLAEHCHARVPPNGLHWMRAIPKALELTLPIVSRRKLLEEAFSVLSRN